MRTLTIIESPYAGDLERNFRYLKRAVLHSIELGERPFASHGFYTQFLDDKKHEERELGIALGYEFWDVGSPADVRLAFYVDYGMSEGMIRALEFYKSMLGKPALCIRRIGENPPATMTEDMQSLSQAEFDQKYKGIQPSSP